MASELVPARQKGTMDERAMKRGTVRVDTSPTAFSLLIDEKSWRKSPPPNHRSSANPVLLHSCKVLTMISARAGAVASVSLHGRSVLLFPRGVIFQQALERI